MNNQVTIFIADDDANITDLLTAFLTKEGYLVQAFQDGKTKGRGVSTVTDGIRFSYLFN